MHEYKVNILKVVDGDTVDVDIDLGFGVWLRDERVRLAGIDTPESRTSDAIEKVFGQAAKERLSSLLGAQAILISRISKSGDNVKGKFGRILGNFKTINGDNVADILMNEGHAVAYNGGNKDSVQAQHLINRQRLIDEGKVIDLGNEENINTELLLDLKPDIVIGFSINSNNKMFATIEKMNIPVILNGAWLEETPLGRAEWIKLFGVLFNKEKEADSIFSTIEKNYLEAKKIALNAERIPTIISGGLFKDIWNLPAGESFEATFLADANTNYLWKDSKGTGSLSLNIENVFEKGKDADIWISPSYHSSLEELKTTNAIYSKFNSFKKETIYSFNNKRGEKGGIIYFEVAPARPDLVLKDLIKIAHPELLKDYEFTFFEKLK